MEFWTSRIYFLKFWLFEKSSNGSIIKIFVYMFLWLIASLTNYTKSNCKSSISEEVNAAGM